MFRHRSLAVACLTALFLVAGCDSAPTHDSLMKDSLSTMEEMVAVMKTVKDEASANAAKPKLQALAEKMKKMKEQADKMEKPSAEKEAALKKEYEPRLQKVMGEMLGETMRIGMDPKLQTAVKDMNMNGAK